MDRDEILSALAELYAEEVEAAIRYLHLSVTLKGMARLTLREEMLQGMRETLEHAQVVAEKILELGGVPHLDMKVEMPAELTSGEDALHTAVEFERAARDAYGELLEKATGDVSMEEFARAQVALETSHLARFRLLLEK